MRYSNLDHLDVLSPERNAKNATNENNDVIMSGQTPRDLEATILVPIPASIAYNMIEYSM
jgi:hypothetical protein